MVITSEIQSRQLAELVKEARAGNEVLLTQGAKPVAKLIAVLEVGEGKGALPVQIRSLKGHRVLTPSISQEELADEMFAAQ